jgi:hypothetical protein
MITSHERDRAAFQKDLDSLDDGDTLELVPREFPGPVVLSRSATLDGHGATVWALEGPVLTLDASEVVLRNLKIEVTGEDPVEGAEERCAILLRRASKLTLDNVEVRGSVIGLREEAGDWHYPHSLSIGQLAHGREHDCLLRIWVPVACRVQSSITGLEIEPRSLTPGANELKMHIERLPADTLLNGRIYLTSAFLKRWIMVNASVSASPAERTNPVVWEPAGWPTPAVAAAPVSPAPAAAKPAPPPPPPPRRPEPIPPPPPPPSPPPVVSPPPVPTATGTGSKISPTFRRVQGSLLSKLFSDAAEANTSPTGSAEPVENTTPASTPAQPSPPEVPKPATTPEATTQEPANKSRKVVRANKLSPLFGGGQNPPEEKQP